MTNTGHLLFLSEIPPHAGTFYPVRFSHPDYFGSGNARQ
jgi:hypothetical protein